MEGSILLVNDECESRVAQMVHLQTYNCVSKIVMAKGILKTHFISSYEIAWCGKDCLCHARLGNLFMLTCFELSKGD